MNKILQIDSINMCNYKCIFCYRGKKNCNIDEFALNSDQVKDILYKNPDFEGVSLVNNGEFLFNPNWKDIFLSVLEFCESQERPRFISLNTNAFLLNSEGTTFILNNMKNRKTRLRITFSLNAADSDTYHSLTGSDSFDKVVENIEFFIINSRKKENLENIVVCVQSLVLQENFDTIIKFIDYWEQFYSENEIYYEICEDIYPSNSKNLITLRRAFFEEKEKNHLFDDFIIYSQNRKDIQINPDIEKGDDYFKRKACKYLFLNPAINDKYVTICCRDTFFEHKYKRVGEPENDREKQLKKYHLEGYFEKIELCRNCNFYEVISYSYLKSLVSSIDFKLYKHRLNTGIWVDIYNLSVQSDNLIDKAKLFLEKNQLFVEYSNIKFNNRILNHGEKELNKHYEQDFCMCWTRNLFISEQGIFAGCDKNSFKIEDYNEFRETLKKGSYELIPDQCFYCREKFSVDVLRDRYYNYGAYNTHSPMIIDDYYATKLKNINDRFHAEDLDECTRLLENIDNYIFYRNFFISLRDKNYDEEFLYKIIKISRSIFLFFEYADYTSNYFEEILLDILKDLKRVIPPNIMKKLFILFFQNKISNSTLLEFVNEKILSISTGEYIYEESLHNFLLKDICFYIIKEIEKVEDISDVISIYKKYFSFIGLPEVNKALVFKVENISEEWNFSTFYEIISKIVKEEYYSVNETIHYRLNKLYRKEGFDEFIYIVDKYDFYNKDYVQKLIHKYIHQVLEEGAFSKFMYYVDKYDLYTIDGVKGAIHRWVIFMLESRNYFTLLGFIKKYSLFFNDIDKEIFEHIINLNSENIDISYIRFIFRCSDYVKHKEIFYKIFSYYMKKENYRFALKYFNKIHNKDKFWERDVLEKTYSYLLKKNHQYFKYLIFRFIKKIPEEK